MKMSSIIKGEIVKGNNLGEKLGFPTLNIKYIGENLGVFVGKVKLDNLWHLAVVNIGSRPTIGDEEFLCESHLIDWTGSVSLGDKIELKLLKKIRDTKKFPDLDSLKKQISEDVEFAKTCYTRHVKTNKNTYLC